MQCYARLANDGNPQKEHAMTRKKAFELAVAFVAVSVFGGINYYLGMQHNAGFASLTVDVTGCDLDPGESPVADLQPL